MKLRHTLIVLGLLIGGAAVADIWDGGAGFEGEPGVNDPVAQGDDEMRSLKLEIRERAESELCWGTMDSTGCAAADDGRLREGAARCFVQTAAPTVIGALDFALVPIDTLDEGRCWVDTDGADGVAGTSDDNARYNYVGGAWVVDGAYTGPSLVKAGAYNLVYNASFDGQVSTSVTVADGWTNVSTATIAYVTTAVSEGVGLAMRTTAAGGANEGASQTLAGLKASTTYRVVARVNATLGDTCSLRTTGGSTNVADTTATTAAYETLEGTFTTDATPTAVVVIIESDADTDVCTWDSVAVYEQSPAGVTQPGIIRARATRAVAAGGLNCAGTYAAGCLAVDSGLEVFITPPGPGYIIIVDASVELEMGSVGNEYCYARLTNAVSTLDEVVAGAAIYDQTALRTLKLHATVINPTPGTAINFEVDVRGNASATACDLEDDVVNWIEAVMVPTR